MFFFPFSVFINNNKKKTDIKLFFFIFRYSFYILLIYLFYLKYISIIFNIFYLK